MKKIAIIGATGHVGQAITQAALQRGATVTVMVRNATKAQQLFGATVTILEKDALALTQADLAGFDVVIDAFASLTPYLHLDLAARLISFFRENQQTRLFFVIGSATLQQANGETLLSTMLARHAGEPWLAGMLQQGHEFDLLKWVDNVNWTAITPSTEFTAGAKTDYKLGGDTVSTSAAGKAEVSYANFAAALLDELDQAQYIKQRFSVVDA